MTTIYHNPNCGTSRNVLTLLLKTPPSRRELIDLLHRMAKAPRDLLRRKGTPTTSSASTIRSGPTTS